MAAVHRPGKAELVHKFLILAWRLAAGLLFFCAC